MNNREEEQKRIEAERERVIAEAKRAHAESNEGTGRVEGEERREAAEEAEEARVIAEALRAHAESNEGSGRRAAAEKSRAQLNEEYMAELYRLRDDPVHYMTPGAKKAFDSYRNKAIAGYLILALGLMSSIYALTKRADRHLRNDINTVAQVQCIGGISTLSKYNDLVESQIKASREARELNLSRGDIKRAKLNTRNIIRLQNDKLPVPTKKQCEHTVLLP